MRILKYILLLISLVALALVVFIATKDGSYSVTSSRVIKLEKSTLFQYVNDYKNWEDFCSLKEDDTQLKFTFPENTVGVGGAFSWDGGLESGKMQTIYLKENDSIAQNISWNGTESKANIIFRDTIGGTKVRWSCKGNQSFLGKFYALFSGGIEKKLTQNFENSLAKLDKVLTKEINTYDISINGLVEVNKITYLKRRSVSKIPDFYTKVQKQMPLLLNFVKDNNVATFGSPFVAFDSYDIPNNLVKFAIAIPLKEEIFTTPESEFITDSILPYQAVKITLKGDYSHSKEAWDKGTEYIKQNNMEESATGTYQEVYTKSRKDIKYPSQWITEIYIPVKAKPFSKPAPEPTLPKPKMDIPEAIE